MKSRLVSSVLSGLHLHVFTICVVLACLRKSWAKTHTQVRSKLVDLGHVFDKQTIYWVKDRPITTTIVHNGTVEGQDYWFQTEDIHATTHDGTHLDAPCHFGKGLWCVSDIPLERLVLPVVVVDISPKVDGNPDVHLSIGDLLEWEAIYGRIPDQSLLLIRTGWSEFYCDPLKYKGTASFNFEDFRFPFIPLEVAQWITDFRNVYGIGMDTLSVDIPGLTAAHSHILSRNIYVLQNLKNLNLVPPTGALAHALPINLKDASGAPVRIVVAL